jgi:hypothetical protein
MMALLRRATPKPGAVRVTHVAPLGTAGVQGWDGEFESPLLQQRVMNEPAVALLGGMMRRPRSGATSPL